jgi:hypothetical protein
MINQGDATFVADGSDERISRTIIGGDTGRWRYDAHRLSDMDGDGALDLVLGQLRRPRNGQDALASKIVFNDGTGRFRREQVRELPHASFFDGWTYVRSLQAGDLNGARSQILYSRTREGRTTNGPRNR